MVEELVKTNEYKIIEQKDGNTLITMNLGEEVAFTCFASKLEKVAMARSINHTKIEELFNKLNPKKLADKGLITIQIIGGNESKSSKEYSKNLIDQLNKIDNGADIINITSIDINERKHPNSFKIDCYHGGINQCNSEIWKEVRLYFSDMVTSNKQKSQNKDKCNIL